jgi:drug/metabolite transporter (DMT)-like permease
MSMGWLLVGKRYTSRQIASVGLLSAGVVIATWSNAHNQVIDYLFVWDVHERRKRRMQNSLM